MSALPTAVSPLARYRPAIIALTVVIAGYTVYYLAQDTWSQPTGLHRSNAVHRRRRGRDSTVESESIRLQNSSVIERYNLDASELLDQLERQLHQEQEMDLDNQPPLRAEASISERSRMRFRLDHAPLRQFDRDAVQFSWSGQERIDNEREFLLAFLRAGAPLGAVLVDARGDEEYGRALANFTFSGRLFFTSSTAVNSAIQQFNSRPLDQDSEFARYRRSFPLTQTRIGAPLSSRPMPARHLPTINPEPATNHAEEPFPPGSELISDNELLERLNRETTNTVEEATEAQSEHSWRESEENDESRKDGQSLLNMLYHIAEEQSRKDGYIHRGVGCNSCGTTPIRGVRYRCSNCPDYDLCEQCESMQIHSKTHLFYKIRIPAPFYDSIRRPQPPRYPGKPAHLANHLRRDLVKSLSDESGCELSEIEALWDQFKCLATTEWPKDPLMFELAIDRDVFDKCFLPAPVKSRKPPNMPIHDRIFAFFDTNNDGLIGFREFVMGVATIRTNDKEKKNRRIFDCYDMDSDGYIRRKDFLRLFWSYYSLTKDFTEDALLNMDMEDELLEGDALRDTLLGSQPISATFTSSVPISHHHATDSTKRRDSYGETTIDNLGDVLAENDHDLGDEDQVIGDMAELAIHGAVYDPSTIPPIRQGMEHEHPLATMDWPPSIVRPEDMEAIMGPLVAGVDVTDVHDRLDIIKAACSRRKKARDDALLQRRNRFMFYEHECDGRAPDQADEEKRRSATRPASESTDERIPLPLEADAGQEYLFQILKESMNELLDPLFKLKEDLHVEAILRFKETMDMMDDKRLYFHTAAFRKVCIQELRDFLTRYRSGSLSGSGQAAGIELDAPAALMRFIEKQQDPKDSSYAYTLEHLHEHKVIDEACYDKIKRLLQPLKRDLDADDDSDSDQSSSSVEENEDTTKNLCSSKVANDNDGPSASESRPLNEVAPLSADTIREETRQAIQRVNNRDAARAEVASGLGNELGRGLEHFDNPSTALEDEINQMSLDDLLAESGFSIAESASEPPPTANGSAQAPESTANCSDPTLPQNRPNSSKMPEIQASKQAPAQSVPEASGTGIEESLRVDHMGPVHDTEDSELREMRIQWKFLIMLDCLVEEDTRRGGAGSLDYEEFQAVMQSPAANQLGFLGMFYDLVLF